MLERRGARVVYAPALQIVPLADDRELLQATRRCLSGPVAVAVATTGIGFRGWMEAADGWGLGDRLRDHLGAGVLLARGPKARGAIRAAGLVDTWSPASESSSEVLDHLLEQGVAGRRIVVQLHGEPLPDLVEALSAAGADVLAVPVYRWVPPEDGEALNRLIDAVVSRSLDAVAFTSAPAVASLLAVAADRGVQQAVLDAFDHDVVAACVGPVTGGLLERRGVRTVQPDRGRLGALVRQIESDLPRLLSRRIIVAGHCLEVRGHVGVVDGKPVSLSPAPMAMLAALSRRPGQVRSRAELCELLPGGSNDEHAVEMAIARLRAALGDPKMVQTIVKRGYRLAYDPSPDPC